MVVDHPSGLISVSGRVVSLSEQGCELRLHRHIEAYLVARVNIEGVWLPVLTRWVRDDGHGWTVGCQFDRPTPDKQRAIRSLLATAPA
jgi:hypothetical protein